MGGDKRTWMGPEDEPPPGTADTIAPAGVTLDPESAGATIAPERAAATLAPPGPSTADTLSPIDTEGGEAPERIGSYTVLGELGRGGMGVVYRAEQDSPKRLVALKVIRSTVATERARRRFAFEAEVLGRLDHPGIAKVFEARYEGLVSWFAMEFVHGQPITWYAEDQNLDVPARMELIALLCDAVHHAHLNGVVHRDLKPANVLVTPEGQPKVLDFGIARAMDADDEPGARQTRVGEIVGTPAYMSPEQASLDPRAIDGRSDVYTIGVIAYELLADRLPLDVSKRRSLQDMLFAIRELEPPRLGRLDRRLRGDVETMVHKALEKDPARRYQSAAAFAEDIRRWQADEPITARAPTAAYQLSLYARRNPVVVSLFGALAAALFLGAATTAALGVQAMRQRNEAVAARAAVEDRNAALVLLQARAVRRAEPTLAVGWLRSLGDRAPWPEALSEAFEARRLGVATDLLLGHTAEVRTVDWSPDGRLVASGGYDHAVRIWDPAARTVRVLDAHQGDVHVVRWSPDGETLLSAAEDGTLRLWRAGTSTVLEGHAGEVSTAAWSPDGTLVASGGLDGTVRLWGGLGGAKGVLLRHDGAVEHVVFSPDGTKVASAATDATGAVIDLATGTTTRLVGHEAALDDVAFSPDGARVATSSDDRTVRVWDAATGAVLAVLPHAHETRTIAFTDDGRLVTSGRDGRAGIWDLATDTPRWIDAHRGVLRHFVLTDDALVTVGDDEVVAVWDLDGEPVWRLLGHKGRLREVAVTADGRLASACEDGTVRLWDLDPTHRGALVGHTGAVTDLHFTPDGQALVSASEDGTARRWDLATGAVTVLRGHADEVERALPLPDGRIATGGRDATVRLWDPAAGRTARLEAPERTDDLAASPDGRWLVAATRARTLRLFDLHAASASDYQGHTDKVLTVAFSPDGTRFASGSADETARIWSVESRVAGRVSVFADDVVRVAFSPDGWRAAAGAGDGTVRVWPVAGGDATDLGAHAGSVNALAWAPQGALLASAGVDRVVRVHDLDAGTSRDLAGHTAGVTALAFVPDGRHLASASEDGTVRVWDLDTGAAMAWTAGDRPVRLLAVSPDGRTVAAAGDDGAVRLWPLAPDTSPAAVRAWLDGLTAARLGPDDALTAPWTVLP